MRARRLLFLGFSAFAVVACEGRIVPQVAVRGSTIVIPIEGSHTEDGAPIQVGYGGELVTDHQRGAFVFELTGSADRSECGGTPCRLVTRGTSTVVPSPNSALMRGEASGLYQPGGYQHVSLVDVPSDAPLGTWHLTIKRERPLPNGGGIEETDGPVYHGTIEIVEHDEEPGDPTPFEAWLVALGSANWQNVSGSVPDVIPQPELRLTFNKLVFAIELTIEYPPETIDVLDVVEPMVPRQFFNANHRAVVLWSDDGEGTLTVRAAAQSASFKQLSVVFDLDDGDNAVLDPSVVQVSNLQAFKADGTPLSATVASRKIF